MCVLIHCPAKTAGLKHRHVVVAGVVKTILL